MMIAKISRNQPSAFLHGDDEERAGAKKAGLV